MIADRSGMVASTFFRLLKPSGDEPFNVEYVRRLFVIAALVIITVVILGGKQVAGYDNSQNFNSQL